MKHSVRHYAAAGALLALLAPAGLRADSSYHVGPEDQLRIQVARHEELGGDVVVLQDGRITLPVIGTLSVTGLTVAQIQAQITQGLRKRLVNPDVTVEVEHPRPQRVFISGAVKVPQALDLKDGWRITEALANAGGLTVRPEVAHGTLFRLPDKNIPLDLGRIYVDEDPTANLRLQPGDVIDVEEPPTVRIVVTGQVQRSGVYDLTRGGGVVEALALAGGGLPTAALSQAYVVRKDGRKQPVDLASLINHGGELPAKGANSISAADLPLEAGDELVLPENQAKIVVWGLVNRPQVYPLPDGQVTTLADAIALAGGFDKRAAKSQIGILRTVNGKETLLKVDMKRLIQGKMNRFTRGKEINPLLQDRDIVYVPETRTPNWSGILPALQGLAGTWFYLK